MIGASNCQPELSFVLTAAPHSATAMLAQLSRSPLNLSAAARCFMSSSCRQAARSYAPPSIAIDRYRWPLLNNPSTAAKSP